MQPILIIVLATAAGVPLGLWLRQNLSTLKYRNAEEVDLPAPGPRWWVVWTSVIALGSLAAAASLDQGPQSYLPLVPLAIAGPWIAAVDFDVLRIPNHVLAPTAAGTLVAVVGLATVEQDWRTLILPVSVALLTGTVLATVHFATRGGIGFGDAKLAAVIGLAVGTLGVGASWLGVLIGSVAALVWAKATRKIGPIPYGPWLLCGSLAAAVASIGVHA